MSIRGLIDDEALAAERLRQWVKAHFGIWITHSTAKKAIARILAKDQS